MFLLGVIFGLFLLPLLDNINRIISVFSEEIIAKHSVKITECNNQIIKLEAANSEPAHSIGFVYEAEEEGFDE